MLFFYDYIIFSCEIGHEVIKYKIVNMENEIYVPIQYQ